MNGVINLAPISDVVIIVDVLSFSTSVDIALSRGAVVYPCEFRNEKAEELARTKGAFLAVSRNAMTTDSPYSLSPESLTRLPSGCSLVLPSPNGATLTLEASKHCKNILTGCLRNARSIAQRAESYGAVISVIAAGERWKDENNSLRPALEDIFGAGAILASFGDNSLSPESSGAVGLFEKLKNAPEMYLLDSVSGRELANMGFICDVEIASQLNVSTFVPIFIDGCYTSYTR
jgi:2-phosphosulfolactate phosphatase